MSPRGFRYQWEAGLGRYRDTVTGRLVLASTVNRALRVALTAQQQEGRSLAVQYQTKQIDLRTLHAGMREVIRNSQLFSAFVARGGIAQMTPADYGLVGQQVREQYGFLADFMDQVRSGAQPANGRFVARAGDYAKAGLPTSHRMARRAQLAAGKTEERNVLHPAEHCEECVEATEAGWVPLGTLPPLGTRTCRGNDHCSVEFREGPVEMDEEDLAIHEGPAVLPQPRVPVRQRAERNRTRLIQRAARPAVPPGTARTFVPAKTDAEVRERLAASGVLRADASLDTVPPLSEQWGKKSTHEQAMEMANTLLESAESLAAKYPGFRQVKPVDRVLLTLNNRGRSVIPSADPDSPVWMMGTAPLSKEEVARKVEDIRNWESSENAKWGVGFTVDHYEPQQATWRHELAHTLTSFKAIDAYQKARSEVVSRDPRREFPDRIFGDRWLDQNVSRYAHSDEVYEEMAEVAALVSAPYYQAGALPKPLETWVSNLYNGKYQ